MTKTLLIVIGLLAALLTAAGIMWYNDPVNTARRQLHDKDPKRRYSACLALASLDDKESIPAIRKLLSDSYGHVRGIALDALGRLQAREATPDIFSCLSDQDAFVRYCAISALGELQAKEALPEINNLLSDPDDDVRISAIFALGTLQDKEHIPQIIGFLSDSDIETRAAAVYTLGVLKAREAIPGIIKLLNDNHSYVREPAIEALVALEAQEAIPEIKQRLRKDDNSTARRLAKEALQKLGLPEEEIKKSLNLYDYLGLTWLSKVRIIHYPQGFHKPDKTVAHEITDYYFREKLEDLMIQLPSVGDVFADIPIDIELWRIELYQQEDKVGTLDFYGVSMQSPYDHSIIEGSGPLLEHIKTLFK